MRFGFIDSLANSFRINGVRTTYSSSAPNSPSGGDRWFEWIGSADRRLKYGWPWEWNGTYWLSPMQHVHSSQFATNSTLLFPIVGVLHPGYLNAFLDAVELAVQPQSAQSVSSYYNVTIRRISSSNAVTNLDTLNTQGMTAAVRNLSTRPITTHIDVAATDARLVEVVTSVGAGAPGQIFITCHSRFRWARP